MGKTSRKKYTPEFKDQVAIEVLEAAIKSHGAPEIINSDQGLCDGRISKEKYDDVKKNHYLRSTAQNAEHHLSGGLCSEERLT